VVVVVKNNEQTPEDSLLIEEEHPSPPINNNKGIGKSHNHLFIHYKQKDPKNDFINVVIASASFYGAFVTI
jgi:hypothetical protein